MKLSIGAVAVVAVLATPLVGAAQDAEISANAGFVSHYYYRGAPQEKASASAGLDVAVNDFSVGQFQDSKGPLLEGVPSVPKKSGAARSASGSGQPRPR